MNIYTGVSGGTVSTIGSTWTDGALVQAGNRLVVVAVVDVFCCCWLLWMWMLLR